MAEKTRVTVCARTAASSDSGVGGFERAIATQLEDLVSLGHEVHLIAPAANVHGTLPKSVTLLDLPWTSRLRGEPFGIQYIRWCRSLAALLREKDADGTPGVVFFHGAAVGALRFARLRSTVISNPHGMEEFARSKPRGRGFPVRWLGRAAAHSDFVIATDTALVPAIRENLGVPVERILTIPNTVDVQKLRTLAQTGTPVEIPRPSITTVGRVELTKGYDLLVDALAAINASPDAPGPFHWIHFGSGTQQSTLESLAKARGVDLCVHNNATDSVVQATLAASDLFVQPSRAEGSSLTTLEAMAHGVPTIVTPVGGMPEKLADGISGFIARTTDSNGVAAAILRAAKSDRQAVAAAAKATVDQRYSRANAKLAYQQLLEAITA